MDAVAAEDRGRGIEDRGQTTEDRGRESGVGGQESQSSPSEAAPGSAGPAEPAKERRRRRKAWAPTGDDYAVYHLVMLDGKSQHYVAQIFGISQPTVSRIVERYERWQAHAGPREEGRLDPAERVRAQRSLTYMRNEKIIRNCLRLAGEVEGFQEVSHSTSALAAGSPTGQRELRIVNSMLDRTGMVSRFMRLAFRVGAEQLKLVEQEPAAMPQPLSDEEQAAEEAAAAAARAEFQAVRDKQDQEAKAREVTWGDKLRFAEQEAARACQETDKLREEFASVLRVLAQTQHELAEAERALEMKGQRDGETEGQREGAMEGEPELAIRAGGQGAVVELKLNNLNHVNRAENGVSADVQCLCAAEGGPQKTPRNVNNARPASDEEPPQRPPRGELMPLVPTG